MSSALLTPQMQDALRGPVRRPCWLFWVEASAGYRHFFKTDNDEWTANASATLTAGADGSVFEQTGADPRLTRTGLSIEGASNRYIVIDIERLTDGGDTWDGTVYYTTAGHSYSSSYRNTFADLEIGERRIVQIDMSSLTAGGTDWIDNTITAVRLDLGSASGSSYLVRALHIGDLDLYVWSGGQPITWDGQTYTGMGPLFSMSSQRKPDALQHVEFTFVLSGLETDLLSPIDESVRGRSGKVWLAMLNDEHGQIIADPLLVTEFTQDTLMFDRSADDTVSLTLKAYEALPFLGRARGDKYSHEKWLQDHDDEGFFYNSPIAAAGRMTVDWRP